MIEFYLGGMVASSLVMWAEWPIAAHVLEGFPPRKVAAITAMSILAWPAYMVMVGASNRAKGD